MQKTAQKRNVLDRFKEWSNVSGRVAEKMFNPEFERVMNNLRESDNKIRAIASGQEIDGESPGDDHLSLKDCLKSVKSYLNRREYMSAVADLGKFHTKMAAINNVIVMLDANVNKVHHEFLFKDLGDEQKEQLAQLHKKFSDDRQAIMVKEAAYSDIADFLHNVTNKRGRALAAWEKRYPKQFSKLKKETFNLLGASEKLFGILLASLKVMASARGSRNVDAYVKETEKIKSNYNTYDAGFKSYYQANIKDFLDKLDILPKEQVAPAVKVEDNKEMGQQEVQPTAPSGTGAMISPTDSSTPPSSNTPTGPASAPTGSDISSTPPPLPESVYKAIQTPGAVSALKPQPVPAPAPQPVIMPPPLTPTAHRKFYDSLEAMSGEHPVLLASFIRKYATKIQDSDPETSINLFKIARSIKV